jgi:hypothetical protein
MKPDFQLLNATLNGASIGYFEPTSIDSIETSLSKTSGKIDKDALLKGKLIDKNGIDHIILHLSSFGQFVKNLKIDYNFFDAIYQSEWEFLKRYFMKEKSLLIRYDNLDKPQIERKIHRLVKNIEGIVNGK